MAKSFVLTNEKNYIYTRFSCPPHFNKKVEKESIKQGIAVIKQVGDAMVINDAHLKVF